MSDDAILTRCPACQTVFAVEQVDLARAGGRVRCGDCMQLFDARAHATDADGNEVAMNGDATIAGSTPPPEPPAAGDSGDAGRGTAQRSAGVGADDAPYESAPHETVDDQRFTETNWFLVDHPDDEAAGVDDAPPGHPGAEATPPTPAYDGAADEPLAFGSAVSGVDASGGAPPGADETADEGFRFGDDTPPDTLQAELAALVGGTVDLDDALDDALEDLGAATSVGVDADENAAPLNVTGEHVVLGAGDAATGGGDDVVFDEDAWDDLLGELDDEVSARIEIGATGIGELDLEFDGSDTGSGEVHLTLEPEVGDAPVALDFELDAADAPGLDLDVGESTPTAAGEAIDLGAEPAAAPPGDASLDLDDDSAAIGAGETIELAGEPTPPDDMAVSAPSQAGNEAPVEPAGDAASLDGRGADAPGRTAVAADDYDDTALDDIMDAMRALETDADAVGGDGADAPADTDGDRQPATVAADGEAAPEAGGEGVADAPPDGEAVDTGDGDALELEAAASVPNSDPVVHDEAGAIDPDAVAALDDGDAGLDALAPADLGLPQETLVEQPIDLAAFDDPEQAEVIVLGEASATLAAVDPDAVEDDPSFAESMIVSPDLAPGKPKRTGLWFGLSLLAAVALLLQSVHAWRGTLATQPYWQDALPRIYDSLGLELVPDWDISQWCIETSGANASTSALDIEVRFSNRADRSLPPPSLKVRIVDAYSDTLAATMIEPAQYFGARDVPARIGAGERVTAIAQIDYTEPRIDSYEVALCYVGEGQSLRCGGSCPK